MPRKSLFKSRNEVILAAVFSLLLASLVLIGNVASERFRLITDSLLSSENARFPKAEVERIRALMGETELAVKAFTLTRDPQFMDDYYQNIYEIIDVFDKLYQDSAAFSPNVNLAIASLDTLVFRRMDQFEVIINSGDEFRVARAMQQVNTAVEGLEEEADAQVATEEVAVAIAEGTENGGRKLLQRLRRDKVETEEATSNETETGGLEEHAAMLEKVNSSIKRIASDERNREDAIRNIILNISKDGKRVNELIDEITSMLTSLEIKSQEENARRSAMLAEASRKAVNIGIFISVALVLIFSMLLFVQIWKTRQLSIAARKASQEALSLAKTKEGFVTKLSHELRTPLNAIIGYSELLEETDEEEERMTYQGRLKKSAVHLHDLMKDLLDWERIESGKFKFENSVFSVEQVVSDVKEIVQIHRHHQGPEFTIYNSIGHDSLYGDPLRLKQVLINLLSNAFKYTDHGTISLSVRDEMEGEDRVKLFIVVKDTGIGIPKEKVDDVFQEFEQVDTPDDRQAGGSGLGLAIARKLVEGMGGNITLKSEVGKGTEISMEIPFELKQEEPVANIDANIPNLSGYKVLVVDDNHFNLDIIHALLIKTGCTVVQTTSARQALILMESQKFDIGVFDLKMPDMDGFDLMQALGKKARKRMRFVALTAALTPSIIQRCATSGFSAFFTKPVNKNELYTRLRRLVMDLEEIDSLPPEEIEKVPAMVSSAQSKGQALIDLMALNDIFEDDVQFRNEMLSAFVQSIEDEMNDIRNAAINMEHERIHDVVHKILPSCRQVGAQQLVEALERLKSKAQGKDRSEDLQSALEAFEEQFIKVKTEIEILTKS